MKYLLDNGFLAYERKGRGIPILFIHGYPLSRKIWIPQLDGLSDIASVISLDLRGHGESYPFESPYPMELLADDCKRLIDSEKITFPIVVCGLSMGGYITFALYRKYPQVFTAMILTSTRARADSIHEKANREVAIKNVHDHGVKYVVDGMLPKLVSGMTFSTKPNLVNTIRKIMLETSEQGVIGASQGMKVRPDSTSLLAQIHCPVLITHGADDQLIPVSEAEAMQQQIPDSRLHVIPEAGHLANMEQPDKYNQIVREFIGALPQP